MDEKLTEIFQVFEVGELPRPLFYNFDLALRFELGGELYRNIERPIARFAQAFTRARCVADTLFGSSDNIQILYASQNSGKDSPLKKRYKSFKKTNYSKSDFVQLGRTSHIEEGFAGFPVTVEYRFWEICNLKGKADLVEFLWLSISAEMPIEPNGLWGSLYIVDLSQKIMLHIYDDRGMDVIAMKRDSLLPIYTKYKDWLLEYDIERMNETFGG